MIVDQVHAGLQGVLDRRGGHLLPALERWELRLDLYVVGDRRPGMRVQIKLSVNGTVIADDTYALVAGEVHRRIALSDPGMVGSAVRTVARGQEGAPGEGDDGALWNAYFASAAVRSGETETALSLMARAKAATSSTQIGCIRCSPPTTGTTGDQRTWRASIGSMPSGTPATKISHMGTRSRWRSRAP